MSLASLPTAAPRWLSFSEPRTRMLGLLLGLALILLANFVLRAKLEQTQPPWYPVFPDDKVPLGWELLLPIDMGLATDDANYHASYHWFTTGLTVVKLLEMKFTVRHVFYFLNAALIVASFGISWFMFRSPIFSFTLTICMAFGTQFHWLYVCSSIECFYLFVIYIEANLLCLMKYAQTGRRSWQVGFVATLILLALAHEQWLDYLGFVTLGSVFLFFYARRADLGELKGRAQFMLLASWAVAIIYLSIRLSYGRQQYRPGHESEMVFTYSSPMLAIEDVISNVITYIYMAFSNYFPPSLVASNSLYQLGPERIVAEQHGYHAQQQELTVMHHVFLWYFSAGIVFAVFVYFLVRNGKAALKDGSVRHAHYFLAMLMVLCGFAIHALVKYRPYLSAPLLTYKCMTSNVGVAFLLAGCLMRGRDWLPKWKWAYAAVVLGVWGVIGYGALARPHYLSHLSRTVGMGDLPDPCRNLRK